MNRILIQTPNEKKDEWLICPIISVQLNSNLNVGTVKVKGVSVSQNVTTSIEIVDVQNLRDGKTVSSLHGYFKLKIADGDKQVLNLFSIINNLSHER